MSEAEIREGVDGAERYRSQGNGQGAPRKFPRIADGDCARWVGVDPPVLEFTIADLVPLGMVTLLVAEGGAGKSLLLQTAITCIPTGLAFLAKATIGGSAVGLFAEDPTEALHWRQSKINKILDVDMEALVGRAFVQSYFGFDAALWRDGEATPFMTELENELAQIAEIRLLIIDNVATVYHDNENLRTSVTAFLTALNGLAARLRIAIILSTHTSKSSDGSTARSASGSTAWVNAARAVLELRPGDDEGSVVLTLIKANHTKAGEKIQLVWVDGVLVHDPGPDELQRRFNTRRMNELIFDMVRKGWERKNPYSETPQTGDRYLPRAIARQGDFKAGEVRAAMVGWMDQGFLVVDRHSAKSPRGLRVAKSLDSDPGIE